MITAGLTFFLLGFFLLSLGTWLSPLLASAIYQFKFKKNSKQTQAPASMSLDILIPAHKEPESLPATLSFFKNLRSSFENTKSKPRILRILVGLSHWTGAEAEAAAAGADQVIHIEEPGKWSALLGLVAKSDAEWVAFVDAGVVWSDNMLKKVLPLMEDPQVMAVNPSYSEKKSSRVQRWVWKIEATLKSIENNSGGPISLHGATIFYRRKELQKALALLVATTWWNDDVVIPLTLRRLYPELRIVYRTDIASLDLFPSFSQSESVRRQRLLLGNLQWVQTFWGTLIKNDPLLAILALRRVVRMMWAWWFVFLALGFGFTLMSQVPSSVSLKVLAVAMLVIAGTLASATGRRLWEAFTVSLLFPFYVCFFQSKTAKVQWK